MEVDSRHAWDIRSLEGVSREGEKLIGMRAVHCIPAIHAPRSDSCSRRNRIDTDRLQTYWRDGIHACEGNRA